MGLKAKGDGDEDGDGERGNSATTSQLTELRGSE